MDSGIQYYYKDSPSFQYRINESVKKFYNRYRVIPKFIKIPAGDYAEEFNYEGQFSADTVDIRFTVRVEVHDTLPNNHVWVLFKDCISDEDVFIRRMT